MNESESVLSVQASPAITGDEITTAKADYAAHHGTTEDAVIVDLMHDPDGRTIGFRLSLDVGGRSRGCDEYFGAWKQG